MCKGSLAILLNKRKVRKSATEMGACCCCCSREDGYNEESTRCICARCCCPTCIDCCCGGSSPTAEEHESLSAAQRVSSSAGLLVGASLETSIPDTYRAPPTPLPFDADMRYLRTSRDGSGIRNDKSCSIQRDSQSPRENTTEGEGEALAAFENLKSTDFKGQVPDSKPSSPGMCQPSKLSEIVSVTDEEDVCPTCLEGYDKENPRILTKCEHHFHLACILEWMERSDNCPVCYQEMIFNETS